MGQQEEQFEGIILRTYPYRDRDLIVRVLSDQGVKRGCLANSARTKRFGTPLDVFDHGIFEVRAGRGQLLTISSFRAQQGFAQIRSDLDAFCTALTFVECVDHMLLEDGPESPESYALLLATLDQFCGISDVGHALRTLYLSIHSLLVIAGYGDPSPAPPSTSALSALLEKFENTTERELQSKGSLKMTISSLGARRDAKESR